MAKLIKPFTKNAPNNQEAISLSSIPALVPTASMIAVGPVTAKIKPTIPTDACSRETSQIKRDGVVNGLGGRS